MQYPGGFSFISETEFNEDAEEFHKIVNDPTNKAATTIKSLLKNITESQHVVYDLHSGAAVVADHAPGRFVATVVFPGFPEKKPDPVYLQSFEAADISPEALREHLQDQSLSDTEILTLTTLTRNLLTQMQTKRVRGGRQLAPRLSLYTTTVGDWEVSVWVADVYPLPESPPGRIECRQVVISSTGVIDFVRNFAERNSLRLSEGTMKVARDIQTQHGSYLGAVNLSVRMEIDTDNEKVHAMQLLEVLEHTTIIRPYGISLKEKIDGFGNKLLINFGIYCERNDIAGATVTVWNALNILAKSNENVTLTFKINGSRIIEGVIVE